MTFGTRIRTACMYEYIPHLVFAFGAPNNVKTHMHAHRHQL